jgi:DNA-binding NarL/FixJ family response regulator
MSQHDSHEMVQETFRAGGAGYLVKSEAGRELLSAIRAKSETLRDFQHGTSGDALKGIAGRDQSSYLPSR